VLNVMIGVDDALLCCSVVGPRPTFPHAGISSASPLLRLRLFVRDFAPPFAYNLRKFLRVSRLI
jgi:hypothetical protein